MIILYASILSLALLFAAPLSAVPQGTEDAWQPLRWHHMLFAAREAREMGDRLAAEEHCRQALWYVDSYTMRGLFEYASLLQTLNREAAGDARAKADKLLESKQRGGMYLGFRPSEELQAFAAVLDEVGHASDAAVTRALADAYDFSQKAHFHRLQAQQSGNDSTGLCE